MRGTKAKALRRKAKPLYLQFYLSLLPEGTPLDVEDAIKYSPQLWKKTCRAVKKNPEITLAELNLK